MSIKPLCHSPLPSIVPMTIGTMYINSIYLLSLGLFINYNSPIFFWLMMEFNLMVFILVLYLDKSGDCKLESIDQLLYYFLIQSSASIFFLCNFSLSEWSSIFNMNLMFITSLLIKIGLFPLFFWVFTITKSLKFKSLFFLLTSQKLPLLSSLFYCFNSSIFIFLFLSFVSGSIILFFSSSMLTMLISSSISYSLIMFFFFFNSLIFFLFFYLIYSFFLGMALFLKDDYTSGSGKKLHFILISLFFLGLPPLGMFFYKFLLSSFIMFFLGPVECFLFFFFSFLGLVGYLKFFFYSFFKSSFLYLKNEFWFLKMSIFCYTISFFLVFIL